jgi:hypothetical protein
MSTGGRVKRSTWGVAVGGIDDDQFRKAVDRLVDRSTQVEEVDPIYLLMKVKVRMSGDLPLDFHMIPFLSSARVAR